MRIGILALQGDFAEHRVMLEQCGASVILIRKPAELEPVEGLIIPGGESTTIGKLMVETGLDRAIVARAEKGIPIFGTCAGMIVLADKIGGSDQFRLRLMDIEVKRNAFGRQVDSFETPLSIPVLGEPAVPAVFIRAPYIDATGPGVEVLARHEGKIVMAQQGHLLAAAFHPELTDDLRVHQYFLQRIQ
jgi:5'-phosphate synthase pdxT subunit